MGKANNLGIPKVDEINGWKTIKTMAKEEGLTVQALYYRVKKGMYKALDFGGIVVVKAKGSKLDR